MSSNHSIVIVGGAWHTTFHYAPLIPHLQPYHVIPIQLETSKSSRPRPTLQENVDPILEAIHTEIAAGRKITLFAHSVGGRYLVPALDQFLQTNTAEHIHSIVLFTTIAMNPLRALSEQNFAIDDLVELRSIVVGNPRETFFNDFETDEEAKPFVDALDENWLIIIPDDEMLAWWAHVKSKIPKTCFFLALRDHAIPPKFQRMEAEEMGCKVVELDVSHSGMCAQPQVLAKALLENGLPK